MRKFLINFSVLILIAFLGYSPVFYFNLVEDPYSIFRSDYDSVRIEPNNHFIKMRYLLSEKSNFDSFIFGSSRANNVKPKQFKNGNYFNLYYSLGVPHEHLEDIRLLLKKGIHIKNVLVLIDYSSYSVNYNDRQNDLLRLHYSEEKMPLLKKYIKYAFAIPEKEFKQSFYQQNQEPYYKNMLVTGTAENAAQEKFITEHPEEHMADEKFTWPTLVYNNLLNETVSDLDSIIQLCKANNIHCVFAFNPIHQTSYLAFDHNLYFDFMERMSRLTDYYDFGGLNKVTTNNYFYYESSHYRPLIGAAMADFIQDGKRIDSIPEFGTYITKENVAARIEYLKSQLPPK